MFMTSRESAIIQSLSTENAARCCALIAGRRAELGESPRSKSEGVLVSRAYLNPENAGVKANFRVLPGFMGVFWKLVAK
jgi:hypothetical protein